MANLGKLSELTGFSRAVLKSRLVDLSYEDGPRNSRLYDTRKALPAIFKVVAPQANLNEARARLAEKQMEKLDFDMEVKRGELVNISEIKEVMQRVFVAFRTRLMSMPTKAAPKVTGLADPVDAQLILEDYIHEALEEISDLGTFIDNYAPAEGDETEPTAPEKDDGKRVGGRKSKAVG